MSFERLFQALQEWFSRIVTLEDMVKEFDVWQRRKANVFHYRNYHVAPLAHAFCLAKNQQTSRANERFIYWCEHQKPQPDVLNKLTELLEKQTVT
jgi:hypothetical protein